ncbi:response regulator [Sanyastnella coralliicola]|uniref:response regulator n=1 Tax=Sanyastnella coralliicola TaxID=3069118 RepID=UPI0027BB0D1D|nr:response regulator [Longitalea sp. SCSIO 12813]
MGEKRKVLYVDDEPINRHIISSILGKEYDVISVESGPQGLESLESDPEIQLIISDLHMPVMSGLEFIQEAQKRHTGKRYFILSGHSLNKEIKEALDSKLINGFFEKPANFKRINAALKGDS